MEIGNHDAIPGGRQQIGRAFDLIGQSPPFLDHYDSRSPRRRGLRGVGAAGLPVWPLERDHVQARRFCRPVQQEPFLGLTLSLGRPLVNSIGAVT